MNGILQVISLSELSIGVLRVAGGKDYLLKSLLICAFEWSTAGHSLSKLLNGALHVAVGKDYLLKYTALIQYTQSHLLLICDP